MQNRKQRGTQVAELALMLPLLCFLIFVIIEGAAFVRTHVILNNAAREGARLSAVQINSSNPTANPGNTACADITTAVQQYVYQEASCTTDSTNPLCNPNNLTIQIVQTIPYTYTGSSGPVQGTASRVTITYPYHFHFLPSFTTPFGSWNAILNLSTSATFRNFYLMGDTCPV